MRGVRNDLIGSLPCSIIVQGACRHLRLTNDLSGCPHNAVQFVFHCRRGRWVLHNDGSCENAFFCGSEEPHLNLEACVKFLQLPQEKHSLFGKIGKSALTFNYTNVHWASMTVLFIDCDKFR